MKIEEIEARLKAGTPGTWHIDYQNEENCSFILSSLEDISKLIKAHKIMKETLQKYAVRDKGTVFIPAMDDKGEFAPLEEKFSLAKQVLAAVEEL